MADIPLALAGISCGAVFPAVFLYAISGPIVALFRKTTR